MRDSEEIELHLGVEFNTQQAAGGGKYAITGAASEPPAQRRSVTLRTKEPWRRKSWITM